MCNLYRLDAPANQIALALSADTGGDVWEGGYVAPGRYGPVVIRDEATAWSLADRCTKPQIVMLGDDAYWVVCPADASRLEKAGYEYAPR